MIHQHGGPLYDAAGERFISQALAQTVFVEAGAGTGKTRALVQRLVALVLAGHAIERIVAITFTEKAAAELRDRVREGLEKAEQEGKEGSDLAAEALRSLDRAAISTIHSFCQGLLHSFAAEAAVDPSFSIEDQMMAERRLQERWRIYLDELAGDERALAAFDRVLALGITPGQLETMARELADRPHAMYLLKDSIPVPQSYVWPNLADADRRLAVLPLATVAETDQLRLRVEAVKRLVQDLRSASDAEGVLAAGAATITQKFGVSRAEDWGGRAAITSVRETAKEICWALAETLAGCRSQALAGIMPFIVAFVESESRRRAREGTMTFDDLIVRVRNLLMSSTEDVRALRERFDAMLIDEFQDTDPLQVDIAMAFATDHNTGKLEPGRLFLVGDPKQSIYRFRRADMAAYWQTRVAVEQSAGVFPELSHNRRSRPIILDWVNRVFASAMGDGNAPGVQPPYRPIFNVRRPGESGPGVASFGSVITNGPRAAEIARLESQQIASCCRLAVDEGWGVAEPGTEKVRPACFKDIAVLIPARTVLPALERALTDTGVPYRVEGGSLIYRTQEVRDVLNCLTAIDDPSDQIALFGALRSPAFACSDLELAHFKAEGGRFDYLRPGLEGADSRVPEAMRTLARYHESRHSQSLAALIESFITDRGQVETGILDTGERNSFRRARFLVEQARAFESAGPESLRAFVSWLDRRATEEMLDNEGAGLDDDEDAVRVLTIHAAKGLEFPIVFLAGMGSERREQGGVFMVDGANRRAAICIGSATRRFQLGDVEELKSLEAEHSGAEFVRLLYVAATRARDHLVFSLFHRESASRSGAAVLMRHGADEGVRALKPLVSAAARGQGPLDGLSVDVPAATTVEEFETGRAQLLARALQERYTSATAEVRAQDERKDETEDITEPWSRGRGATRIGRAVHATLQSVGLDASSETVMNFARAQAAAEAVPNEAPKIARLVRAALASKAAGRARRAKRALREVPFALRFDGTTVEGFIDLVIEDGDGGLEIVDWKTDDVPATEVPGRLADYRLQAGLYGLGLSQATGRPVTRLTYVFAASGVEASPGQPDELIEAATQHLRTAAQTPL